MRRLVVPAFLMLLGMGLGTRLVGPGAAASLPLTSQALTPYRSCTVTATPTTTAAVTDSTVRQASPTTNYGTATTDTIASASAANRRLYLRFDLTACNPAIPPSAIVRLATLRLYASALPAACRTVDLFSATMAWSEAGAPGTNQPFGSAINNPPAASASASFAIGTPTGCANRTVGTIAIAVTADVAAFVAGPATNAGWMLRDSVEGSASAYTSTFSAKELGALAQAPQLIVSYVTVP